MRSVNRFLHKGTTIAQIVWLVGAGLVGCAASGEGITVDGGATQQSSNGDDASTSPSDDASDPGTTDPGTDPTDPGTDSSTEPTGDDSGTGSTDDAGTPPPASTTPPPFMLPPPPPPATGDGGANSCTTKICIDPVFDCPLQGCFNGCMNFFCQ
jgi:hypothetical protein